MTVVAALRKGKHLLSSSWTRGTLKAMSTTGTSEGVAGKDYVVVERIPVTPRDPDMTDFDPSNFPTVTMIGINRPEKKNCVNTPTAEALLQAFQEFDEDESSRSAILYGVGGCFCAGYDLQEVSESPPTHLNSYDRGPMGPSRYVTKKPVVAAVEGYAVAGGLELALWCDLRVVEDTAVMGVFCRRLGVPLIDGGTVRLPAIVGLGRALDLILTGRPIKGKEALEFGLANRLVPCGTAIGQALELADELARLPPECMWADRASALNATFSATSLQEALKFEHENGIPVIMKESVAGAQKFVDGHGRHGKMRLDLDAQYGRICHLEEDRAFGSEIFTQLPYSFPYQTRVKSL